MNQPPKTEAVRISNRANVRATERTNTSLSFLAPHGHTQAAHVSALDRKWSRVNGELGRVLEELPKAEGNLREWNNSRGASLERRGILRLSAADAEYYAKNRVITSNSRCLVNRCGIRCAITRSCCPPGGTGNQITGASGVAKGR